MTDPINGLNAPSATSTPSPAGTPPAGYPPAARAAEPGGRPRRKGGLGRVVKWLVVLLLLLVVAAGLVIYFYLDPIVRRTVESQASSQLNLKTELDGAHVSLFGGEVSLRDLRIASPQGFAAPQMFTLGQADVRAKVSDLRGDPVRVSTITLNKPKLVIENNGGTFNFKKAMELMPQTPQKPADQSEAMKVVIGDLTIKDPTVVVRPGKINIPGINLPEEITVPIPTVSLKNIGTGEGSENGAAVKDVVMQVITVMAAKAAESDKLPDQLKNLLNVDVKQVVAGLTAEARRRVAEALPGEAGRVVSEVLADPSALLKNPGGVVQGEAERQAERLRGEAEKRLQGVLGGGGTTQPSASPATQPADRAKQEAGKAIEQGLGGLLNRDKKKK